MRRTQSDRQRQRRDRAQWATSVPPRRRGCHRRTKSLAPPLHTRDPLRPAAHSAGLRDEARRAKGLEHTTARAPACDTSRYDCANVHTEARKNQWKVRAALQSALWCGEVLCGALALRRRTPAAWAARLLQQPAIRIAAQGHTCGTMHARAACSSTGEPRCEASSAHGAY